MIKFTALIHKETGTVIKYLEWKQHIEAKLDKMVFTAKNNTTLEIYDYPTKEMLFSDDFEIIYDSEFTVDELYRLYGLSGELATKIAKSINQKEGLFTRYGIEV